MRLKGSLQQAGSSITLNDGATTSAVLTTSNSAAATLTLPSSTDTLVGRASTDTLTNKTIDGGSNTITGLAYSSVSLTGSIVNADVAAGAAIAYSKLALGGSVVNADIATAAAIAYSKLTLTGSVVNADISGTAAIAYSKLTLTGSVVNADISGTAAIAYSKLDLAGAVKLASDVTGVLPAANGGTGVLSTATFPTAGVVVTEAGAETLTNKTLTAPVISSIVNTGTLTLPTSTDTLVGRATTDTLTNKTLTSPTITTPTHTSYQDLTEVATPAAPAASKLRLYAKSDDNLYVQTSAGIEKAVGSGSGGGSGQKNYVSSTASSTWVAASWTAFGTVAGSTDTTAADLPRATTTASGWKLTPSGSAAGTFTVTVATPAVFTATAHGMLTGFPVTFSTTGALPTGLTAGTVYYVNVLSTSTFNVATTMANLLAGTYVATSGTQSGTQSFTFGGAYTRFTLDAADYGVKQQVQHAQNILSGATGDWGVDVYSNTASDYSGTYTRLPLSTDSSGSTALPNLEGTFRTTFDAPGAAAQYIELRFNKLAANTHALVGSDLVVGPGVVTQGAVATGWYAATAPAGGWINTGPTNVSVSVSEQRTGSSVFLDYAIAATGSSAAFASLILNLPNGYALDPTYLPLTSSSALERLGEGQIFRNGSSSGNLFAVNNAASTTSILVYYETGAFPDIRGNVTNAAPVAWNNTTNTTYLHLRTKLLPIASLAGSGTVNVAQNDVMYAWNSSTSTGTDSTSFGYGPGGVLFQAFSGTGMTGISKRVRFQASVPVGVTPTLEFKDTSGWAKASERLSTYGSNSGGTAAWGYRIVPVSGSSTDFDVVFYATADQQATWSTFSTWYWRLTVGQPGQATAFGIVQPGIASGLVSAAGVPGNTTGNAIASGYVGQQLTASPGTAQNAAAAGTWSSPISISVGPGIFLIRGMAALSASGITGGTNVLMGIGTASGNNAPVAMSTATNGYDGSSQYQSGLLYVNVSAATTYYLQARVDCSSIGTATWSTSTTIEAVRIA